MARAVIGGREVGRLHASFMLAAESFRFLWRDPELLVFPIIGFVLNVILVLPVIGGIGWVVSGGSLEGLQAFLDKESSFSDERWLLLVWYCGFASAFSLACVQAGVSHLVIERSRNAEATFGGAVHTIAALIVRLVYWAFITSTVGFVLRTLAERSRLLGRIVIGVIGVAWSVLTYFTVPVLVAERTSVVPSIKKSSAVFRATWGETIVSNISLSGFILVSMLMLMGAYGLVMYLLVVTAGSVWLFVLTTLIFVCALMFMGLISSTMNHVLKTVLYIYATTGAITSGINPELVTNLLVRSLPPAEPTAPTQSANA